MPDFWRSSGYRLIELDPAGGLVASDDFLRALVLRPELVPVPESCAAELALHEALLENPRLAVPEARLATLADADARDNYRVLLAFRDRLVAAPTIEAAYLDLLRRGSAGIPPLFIDQLVHVILRHLLRDCADPLRLRAAELLFREQKVTIQDGRAMLADDETVEMQAAQAGFGTLAGLLDPQEGVSQSVALDVLDEANAPIYWSRSDRFDTVLDLGFARPGLDALCRVLESWVQHFTGAGVVDPAGAADHRRALGLACRPRPRGELAAQRPLRRQARGRRAAGPPARAVPPGVSRSRRHVAEGARASGLSRPRHDRRRPAQAQAAEPAGEPAACGAASEMEDEDERGCLQHEPAEVPQEGRRDLAARDREGGARGDRCRPAQGRRDAAMSRSRSSSAGSR